MNQVSEFVFEDGQSSVPEGCFPLLHLFLVEALQTGGSSDGELLPSELKLFLDDLPLLDESPRSLLLGLGLEPVGGS